MPPIATAQFAVMSPDLFDAYRRELLDNVLWLVTAAPSGKYKTRFRCHAAVTNPNAELRHEHVYTRRSLIKRMLDDPGCIEKVVHELAIGCVVTKAEHKRLSQFDKSHEGWERYRAAGIEVLDMAAGDFGQIQNGPGF